MSTTEPNPFAPPEADIASAGAAPDVSDTDLATRGQRFGGAMIDGLIMGASMIPALIGISFATFTQAQRTDKSPLLFYKMAGLGGVIAGVAMLVLMIINWYLLTKRGQTMGKIVAGTRVVMLDGSRASFTKVVALRAWPLLVLQYLPGVRGGIGGVLSFVDVLFIFRADRRCLHDLIAGTKVVRAS